MRHGKYRVCNKTCLNHRHVPTQPIENCCGAEFRTLFKAPKATDLLVQGDEPVIYEECCMNNRSILE